MNMKADFSLMEKFLAIVLYPKHKKSIHPKIISPNIISMQDCLFKGHMKRYSKQFKLCTRIH